MTGITTPQVAAGADPRKGKPSASMMQQAMDCEAMLPLLYHLQERNALPPDTGDDDSRYGTRIHHLCAMLNSGFSVSDLEDKFPLAEIQAAEDLVDRGNAYIRRVLPDFDDLEYFIENRFWTGTDEEPEMVSAQLDLWVYSSKARAAVLVDYKALPGEVPMAVDNWQLATQAATILGERRAEKFHMAIVQSMNPITEVSLDSEAIASARMDIHDRVVSSRGVNPFTKAFNPSALLCKYCACALHCPANRFNLNQASNTTVAVGAMSNNDLSGNLHKAEKAEKLIDNLRSEAIRRIKLGESIPGFGLSEPKGKRQVKDAAGVIAMLRQKGVNQDGIDSVLSVGITKLEPLFRKATGLKGKACADELTKQLEPFVEMSTPSQQLIKVGPCLE